MTPEEFPQRFAEGWALAKPAAFLGYFMPIISLDAMFSQPMFATAHGHEQIERLFRQIFARMPDLTVTPARSAVGGGTVFIESDCAVTGGRRPVHFKVCDRFLIEHGMIVERQSFSDPLPVMLATLRRPTAWPRLLRTAIG